MAGHEYFSCKSGRKRTEQTMNPPNKIFSRSVIAPFIVIFFQFWMLGNQSMVALSGITNDCSRISSDDGKIRKFTLYVAVCRYDAAFADGRVGHDCGVWSNKGVFTNVHASRNVTDHFLSRIGFSVQANGLMT